LSYVVELLLFGEKGKKVGERVSLSMSKGEVMLWVRFVRWLLLLCRLQGKFFMVRLFLAIVWKINVHGGLAGNVL
jgi:hypothetical protein